MQAYRDGQEELIRAARDMASPALVAQVAVTS
jgi:hypothetical protein